MFLKFNLSCRKSWLQYLVSLSLVFGSSPLLAQTAAASADSAAKKPAATSPSGTKAKKKASSKKATKKVVAPSGTPQGSRSVADATNKPSTKANSSALKSSSVKPSTATRARTTAGVAAAGVVAAGSISAVRSNVVLVQDLSSNTTLFSRNDDVARPIASITKLMTAIVIVDANQSMSDIIEVTSSDVDTVKHSRSRLPVGTKLSRGDMMHLALMSSENRAANALGRHYPGGMSAFVAAMNSKAKQLGMTQSRFVEPTGLSSENVASPRDLVKLLQASASRPAIRHYTTDEQHEVRSSGHPTLFRNTNMLVMNPTWDIKVSKTGYINEAGQCLVMLARINNRDMAIILLNADGKGTRVGDAVKIKQWVQQTQVVVGLDSAKTQTVPGIDAAKTQIVAGIDGAQTREGMLLQ
jgi:D-alanyl-D-alanine endopeptidase (penicillin-binding protein 7)